VCVFNTCAVCCCCCCCDDDALTYLLLFIRFITRRAQYTIRIVYNLQKFGFSVSLSLSTSILRERERERAYLVHKESKTHIMSKRIVMPNLPGYGTSKGQSRNKAQTFTFVNGYAMEIPPAEKEVSCLLVLLFIFSNSHIHIEREREGKI
jgi:hypothetical protein